MVTNTLLPGIDPALYPFRHVRFELPDGLAMNAIDQGTGPTVVMVHGNPSWSFHFRALVQALSGTHRCIVPDHIGCGLSDKPGDDRYPYTLDRRIEDLGRLIHHLAPTGPITLVLHDWGGMIGMGWAMRNLERVARIVLLNTASFSLPPSKPLPWQLRVVRSPLGPLLVRGFNGFARGTADLATTRTPMPAAVRRAYLAPYADWASRIATLRFVQDIPLGPGEPAWTTVKTTGDQLDRLASIPVLICWGDRDPVFDHHFLAEWQRRVPHAQVFRFADCGHYLLEDAPEEVVAHVRDFFAAHPVQ